MTALKKGTVHENIIPTNHRLGIYYDHFPILTEYQEITIFFSRNNVDI